MIINVCDNCTLFVTELQTQAACAWLRLQHFLISNAEQYSEKFQERERLHEHFAPALTIKAQTETSAELSEADK